MEDRPVLQDAWTGNDSEAIEMEVRRVGARLRHFRGVAVSVMDDALKLWREVWEALQDTRSCGEILEAGDSVPNPAFETDRAMVLEKLHLLGIRIEYARRLCLGAIGEESREEGDHEHA